MEPDQDKDIESKMCAWAEPIAKRLLAGLDARKLKLPDGFPTGDGDAERLELVTALISGIMLASIGETAKELLPREQQEAGEGAITFARETDGEVCLRIPGARASERMSIRDPYKAILGESGFSEDFIRTLCESVEKAILAGEVFLGHFVRDPARSTPEEAVYFWKASDEEREMLRQAWRLIDCRRADIDERRRRRGEQIEQELSESGSELPDFIKNGLTAADLVLALDILGSSLELLMNIDEEPWRREVVLCEDGSVLLSTKSREKMEAAWLLDRLTADFKAASDAGLPIDPITFVRWCVNDAWRVFSLFDRGMMHRNVFDGMAIEFVDTDPAT